MDKLSICCVSQSFLPYIGGLAKYVEALGKEFIKNGNEFRVIHFKTPGIQPIDFSDGIEMIRANIPNLGEETLKKYMRFKELILNVTHEEPLPKENEYDGYVEYIQVNEKLAHDVMDAYQYKQFDILNIHDFQTLPLASILRKKFGLKIPMVFTWHIPFIENIPQWWKKFFITHMADYEKVVFSTDSYVAAARTIGIPEKNIVKISPFIDTQKIANQTPQDTRKKYGLAPDDFLIVCVSRIDPRKGQEILISALDMLVNESKKKKVQCIFVGNGSFSKELLKKERSARMETLIKMASDKGLASHTQFTGNIPDNEVANIYAAADVVIQPSIQEGFGLTMSEAMAFGKPVIGSNVGGIPDQIAHGVNGYLFEKGDSRALAEAIDEMYGNPALGKTMGENGKRMVNERFSSQAGYAKYLKLYQEVLNATSAQP